jgi:hypothetical protein
MDWLEAVMHSFSTMGLGGFSNHDASFGHFNSPAIEAVAIVFMLLAGINFATHFVAVHSLSFRPYRHDPEAGWFLAVTLGSVVAIAIYPWPWAPTASRRSPALCRLQRRFDRHTTGLPATTTSGRFLHRSGCCFSAASPPAPGPPAAASR